MKLEKSIVYFVGDEVRDVEAGKKLELIQSQ